MVFETSTHSLLLLLSKSLQRAMEMLKVQTLIMFQPTGTSPLVCHRLDKGQHGMQFSLQNSIAFKQTNQILYPSILQFQKAQNNWSRKLLIAMSKGSIRDNPSPSSGVHLKLLKVAPLDALQFLVLIHISRYPLWMLLLLLLHCSSLLFFFFFFFRLFKCVVPRSGLFYMSLQYFF